MSDTNNNTAFTRFADLLETRRTEGADALDIREHVLSLRDRAVGFGYVGMNFDNGYAANVRLLLPKALPVESKGFAECSEFIMSGAIFQEAQKSHKGGVRLLNRMPQAARLLLTEQGFLASALSWSHAFRNQDPQAACLGYVYDDMAHYFMADYPNRLTQKLNSAFTPDPDQTARARSLIERIVTRRISKYNAQPMAAPTMTEGYSRRVLVCDQAFADASTVYGKIDEAGFEAMLLAAIMENPDAEILVKSHPDTAWEPASRTGYFAHLTSSGRVRLLREPVNPFSLFQHVDTVYVGTSGMGLEALLAGKRVVCFGAPFYAGWGLTDDRQPIPHRHRTRSLEDLFHIFYDWYTIYHVPGAPVPSRIEDALDYIETHRPVALPPSPAEVAAPPKVSVILPVYGVEAYIEECLASIQRQTLREIEIIPVNDQSPDGSQAIIDRLAAEDPRIRPIILPQNVGQGFARNEGIAAARGDYIWFIDSDDVLARPDLLARLVEKAEAQGAQMVRARKLFERVENADGTLSHLRRDVTERHFEADMPRTNLRDNPALLHNRHFWTWLYDRDFLQREEIRFVNTQWEERPFLLKALLRAQVLSLADIECTIYRVRPDSTARRKRTQRDLELQLSNFGEVSSLFLEAGADRRDSPLRPHMCFTMSQYLHYLIVGFPYALSATRGMKPDRPAFLETMRTAFIRLDFRPQDISHAPMALGDAFKDANAYGLMLAAIRAQDDDLLARAAKLEPIPQDNLIANRRLAPAHREASDLQSALNTYARNDRVILHAPARKHAVPPPRLILHIGATKTGSTYLQHLMETNRPALMRNGVWYPEVGLFWQPGRPHKQAGHAHFTPAAARGQHQLRAHIDAGLSLMKGQIHTIVLSSEAFFLQEHSHRLVEYFDGFETEMIVYLRRQDEWANSQYCEFVAGGAVGRVSVPIEDWLRDPVTRARLDYRNVLDRFSRVMPAARIKPRIYDRSRLKDGDLIADFADVTGLPQLLNLPRPDLTQANDARLSAAHVHLLRHYNGRDFSSQRAYFGFIEEAAREIVAWREANGVALSKPMVLSLGQRAAILAEAREANAQIARDWFGRPDGSLFDEALPASDPLPEAIYAQEIDLVERAFAAWVDADRKQPQGKAGGLGKAASPGAAQKAIALSQRYDIVNYGFFGWRRWGLTPFVRRQVAAQGTQQDLAHFDRDPAGFMHSLTRPHHKTLAGRLYPQHSVYGPREILRLSSMPLSHVALRLGGRKYQKGLRENPVLFFRLLRNPVYRGLGRLLYPFGEAVPKSVREEA